MTLTPLDNLTEDEPYVPPVNLTVARVIVASAFVVLSCICSAASTFILWQRGLLW